MSAPPDPTQRRQWRLERRRVAARLHPDRGGDVEAYLAELDRVDARFGVRRDRAATGRATTTAVVVRRTRRARLARSLWLARSALRRAASRARPSPRRGAGGGG